MDNERKGNKRTNLRLVNSFLDCMPKSFRFLKTFHKQIT